MNKLFASNVGLTDRMIRIVIGIVLLAIVFTGPRTPWGWIGIIPLFTGLAGICPLYGLLGLSTKRREQGQKAA
jgi:hypothetical protein